MSLDTISSSIERLLSGTIHHVSLDTMSNNIEGLAEDVVNSKHNMSGTCSRQQTSRVWTAGAPQTSFFRRTAVASRKSTQSIYMITSSLCRIWHENKEMAETIVQQTCKYDLVRACIAR